MKKNFILPVLLLCGMVSFSQTFEEPKPSGDEFEKVNVKLGGDFALQYQILKHTADSALIPLGTGFNLPTANLNLDVMLASGVKLNLVTYLSSRHHNEAWVKGGYLLIDELPFLKSPKADKIMDYLTIKVGDMEVNYGDAHFRRSDNGHVTGNPFVGNYIMDAFTTATSMEVMFRDNGLLLMGAVSSGTLRPDLVRFSNNTYSAYDAHKELVFYWKAGFDKQFTEDIRARLTVSGWHQRKHHFGSLYSGDRAGSRYYLIMNRITDSSTDTDIKSNHTSGRWSPGTTDKDNSLMINLFGKACGFELFGTYEMANGAYGSGDKFKFSQIGIEGLYRFGGQEQFYGGARYNLVNGDVNTSASGDQSINRIQVGAGWFILESTVLKIEYVKQNYVDFISDYGAEAGFDGLMIEAAISF
ncbi:MAG TPA: hypothetical protein VJ346_07525 [Bacteroidales bacterium]|nr:hypothetical protein [Bacteroidales bacterium]